VTKNPVRPRTRSTDVQPFKPYSSLVRVDVSALTDRGLIRPTNEDHYFVARIGRSLETLLTNLPDGSVPARADEVGYAMIVADGMGGHAAGEVASRMAISALISLSLDAPNWIGRIDEELMPELARRLRERLSTVNALIIETGRRDAALRGMGTTMTALRSIGRDALVFHVGDSRAYLLHEDRLHRLTRDHTYAQFLADCGDVSDDDEEASRFRHMLTNALGGRADDVQVDVERVQLADGDRVLLCSDGLTDLLDDVTIEGLLATGRSAEVCQRLVSLALERGGRDNITAIVAAYTLPPGSDT
jgi:serine/threonine protein phosphatase PrpC